MRRNTYLLTALLSAGLMACHNEPAFKVEGTVSGAADKMLYLEHTSLEGIVKVDSVKLMRVERFTFRVLVRILLIFIGFDWIIR